MSTPVKKRLFGMVVKNVAAVGSPANRRKFLMIKSAEQLTKDESVVSFGEALMGQRMWKIYDSLSQHYSALMTALDSVRREEGADKAAGTTAALNDYLTALKAALPGMLNELVGGEADLAKTAEILRQLRPGLQPLEKSGGENENDAIQSLVKGLDAIITEVEAMSETKTEKKMDAGVLRSLGHSMSTLFAKAMGADDATLAELEKSAGNEPKTTPVDPAILERLAKSEETTKTLLEQLQKSNELIAGLTEREELRKFADEVAGFKEIGLDPTKDAMLLKSISEKLPKEHADRVREIFRSAIAAKSAVALMGEVGTTGAGIIPGSVAEEVQNKVNEIMSKNDKVDAAAAQSMVFQTNPGLYDKWRQETSVRS